MNIDQIIRDNRNRLNSELAMSSKNPINCVNCGAKAERVRFGGGLYQCRCTGCGSLGRLTPYKSDAVTYWNNENRPEPETLPETVGFVSISADEYAEYMRLKEAAKPLSIDEMREYCMNWAMSQSSGVSQQISLPLGLELRFRQYASELTWFLDKSNFPKFGSESYKPYQREEEFPDVVEYLIIRAIERGELGGHNG